MPEAFDLLLPAGAGRGPLQTPHELAEHYAHPAAGGARAWLRANMVASIDGAAAGADGRSASLSTPADRVVFHLLRGLADVVLVGAGTARTEQYSPAVPHPDLAAERSERGQPVAAVIVQVSRSGRVHTGNGMFEAPGGLVVVPAASVAAVQRARSVAGSDRVLAAPTGDDGEIDLGWVLAQLCARGLPRVLCEGGPALLGQVAAQGLLDELCLSTSPTLGSGSGLTMLGEDPVPGRRMRLAGLLHADAMLFARWVRE